MNNKRVLVTGASGFIGSCLVEHMMRITSYEVLAGIRSWATAARLSRLNPIFIQCDVLDKDQLEKVVKDVDVIVHCAVGDRKTTVEGTKNILEAARKNNIRHFIHMSTVEVYGDVEGEIDETSEMKYTGNPYNEMKIEAEKICQEYTGKGVPVTILRPAIVYGPYSTLWTERFAIRLASGIWGTFGEAGKGTCNLTYIYDLTGFILNIIERENSIGKSFNVVNDDKISWNEYFTLLNERLSMPPLKKYGNLYKMKVTIFIPVRNIAKIVMGKYIKQILKLYKKNDFAKSVMKIGERSIKSTPTKDEYMLYGRKVYFKNNRMKEEAGYRSFTALDKGSEYSVDWIKKYGVI